MVVSPCISICKTDPDTGFCYGCGRTDEEKLKIGQSMAISKKDRDSVIDIINNDIPTKEIKLSHNSILQDILIL